MTKKEHKNRHLELHKALDELVADFLSHNKFKLPSSTTLYELMKWSHGQTFEPTELYTDGKNKSSKG